MPATMPEQTLLRVPEVARRLNLGRSTVYMLMDAGRLGYVRLGRSRRIPVSAVEKLLAENTVEATA
ncbi:MAG TPA: helix-turn-helix domain-containing protein [Pirellulales bacterium]|nr:helix-turn-helix domain-containing protein [Pirellulales bacterium]